MTRSGRMTTHPVSNTKITRASAAMPGVVSVRPLHAVGEIELPIPLPVMRAATHAVLKTATASVRSHAERRKRTVRMYSTPSGHAVAINTNDPNSTATPSEISKRDSPSGPLEPDGGTTVSWLGVTVSGGNVELVTGVEPPAGVVVDATVPTVSLAMLKENVELPPPWPSG